jgi:hypothetical protein
MGKRKAVESDTSRNGGQVGKTREFVANGRIGESRRELENARRANVIETRRRALNGTDTADQSWDRRNIRDATGRLN